MKRRVQLVTAAAIAFAVLVGCARARHYHLKGQVLSVDSARQEVTIQHEDIPGFMPAMTMPFKVRDPRLVEGMRPGDLVTATLVIARDEAHLSAIARTGHTELTDAQVAEMPPRVLAPGETVPDIALVDQDGVARKLADWRGRAVALTFVYTRCPLPDFCPRMDRNFAAVQRELRMNRPIGERVHLLSISFDPDYDTPAVLRDHAGRVGAEPDLWTYGTADRNGIDAFARQLGMAISRTDPERVEIVHNLRTAVIDGDGRLVAIFNGNDWTPADLLAALKNAARVQP